MKIFLLGWGDCALHSFQTVLGHPSCQVVGAASPANYDYEKLKQIFSDHNICFKAVENPEEIEPLLKETNPDLMFVASYPRLLKSHLLDMPKYGSINIHTASLPKNRGFHPLNWALIRGDEKVGVTVHWLTEGMDDGNIIEQQDVTIEEWDDINSIKTKTSQLADSVTHNALEKLIQSQYSYTGIPQNLSDVTFAPKRKPEDSKINWHWRTRTLFNFIRALKSPYPNAFCQDSQGETVLIEESFVPKKSEIGQVVGHMRDFALVATPDGVIAIKTDRRLDVGECLN